MAEYSVEVKLIMEESKGCLLAHNWMIAVRAASPHLLCYITHSAPSTATYTVEAALF